MRTIKAAVKLDMDLQTLEEFWPQTLNVTVRGLRGWEPLSAYEKQSDLGLTGNWRKQYRRMRLILKKKNDGK